MPSTLYVDLENGNDANNGTSFALRKKTYGSVNSVAASGDTVRVMASTDAVSLAQNGTFTDTRFMDAAVAIVSSTNATPIVVTLSSGNYTLLAPAVGKTVVIADHTTNTNANGWWKISAVNGSTTITLVNADGTNSVGNGAGGATGTVRDVTSSCITLTTALRSPETKAAISTKTGRHRQTSPAPSRIRRRIQTFTARAQGI